MATIRHRMVAHETMRGVRCWGAARRVVRARSRPRCAPALRPLRGAVSLWPSRAAGGPPPSCVLRPCPAASPPRRSAPARLFRGGRGVAAAGRSAVPRRPPLPPFRACPGRGLAPPARGAGASWAPPFGRGAPRPAPARARPPFLRRAGFGRGGGPSVGGRSLRPPPRPLPLLLLAGLRVLPRRLRGLPRSLCVRAASRRLPAPRTLAACFSDEFAVTQKLEAALRFRIAVRIHPESRTLAACFSDEFAVTQKLEAAPSSKIFRASRDSSSDVAKLTAASPTLRAFG